MSKIGKLRKHLESGKTVTGLQAINWWEYYRLSDGIYKLRNKGLAIECNEIRKPDGTTYGRYRLVSC